MCKTLKTHVVCIEQYNVYFFIYFAFVLMLHIWVRRIWDFSSLSRIHMCKLNYQSILFLSISTRPKQNWSHKQSNRLCVVLTEERLFCCHSNWKHTTIVSPQFTVWPSRHVLSKPCEWLSASLSEKNTKLNSCYHHF